MSVHVQVLAEMFARKGDQFQTVRELVMECHLPPEAILPSNSIVSSAKEEPLVDAGVISDVDGSAMSLSCDSRLEISGTEVDSEARSSNGVLLDDDCDEAGDQVCVLGGARSARDVRGVSSQVRH